MVAALPAVLVFILTVSGSTYGRHTAHSPTNSDTDEASAEMSDESIIVADKTKFRLDYNYHDTADELGVFASYQFEGGTRPTTTTTSAPAEAANATSNANATTSAPAPTAAPAVKQPETTPIRYGAGAPVAPNIAAVLNPNPNPNPGEEDESEVIVTTTPLTIDSLGSVVKINNTDDESSEENCDEGEVRKVSCNTCVCTDGVFFCSKKTCDKTDEDHPSEPADLLGDIHSDDAAIHLIMEKVVPVFGSTSNNKHAHGVQGQHKNKWSWKKKGPTTPLPDCTNGMTKTIDCNNCLCTKGRWHCTKSGCIALSLREKASYTDGSVVKKVEGLKENHHLDEDCLEGATREANCNQCVCHYNSWSCTNLPCSTTKAPTHIKDIEEACQVEGDVKSKECNLCRCRRGVWVCSANNCMVFGVAKIPYHPPKFRKESVKTK